MNFYITPWHWVGFSLILLCVDLFVGTPGINLLWLAIASFILSIVLSCLTINFWAQLGLLAVLSALFCWLGKILFKDKAPQHHNPQKNLINTTLLLQHPIKNGTSRVHIRNAIWRVEGPDLAAGTKVIIIGVKDNALLVDRVDYESFDSH